MSFLQDGADRPATAIPGSHLLTAIPSTRLAWPFPRLAAIGAASARSRQTARLNPKAGWAGLKKTRDTKRPVQMGTPDRPRRHPRCSDARLRRGNALHRRFLTALRGRGELSPAQRVV